MCPRGTWISKTDAEYVSIFLQYNGDTTTTNPVPVKAEILSKTKTVPLTEGGVGTPYPLLGVQNFKTREDVIREDLDEDGTFTIKIQIVVGTEKRKIWYPKLTPSDPYRTKLYGSVSNSDVTFVVGTSRKEFFGHKWILELRAISLYELILTDAEDPNNTQVELSDMNEVIFETLFAFIYKDTVPTITTDDEEQVHQLLLAADRFGCTDLKLYMESILVDKFVSSSNNVIGLLMFADSCSCALLKEACLQAYVADAKTVTEANPEAWQQLIESTALLIELLSYATSDHKTYVPVVPNQKDNHQGTTMTDTATKVEDINDYDVTSLLERLTQKDLDCDGSREILLHRWKEYLLSSSGSSITTVANSTNTH